jgi:bifunctional DNA-binding transcriptional regulator/antitoxin component of YhaV-PrlF toxin-antitoxin module
MNDFPAITFKTKLQNGRIPLPSRLRTLAGVSDGDPVSVTLIQGRFVVTPAGRRVAANAPSRTQHRAVLSRLRADAPASLKAMWADSRRHGTNKMTMRQIDALIAQVRAQQASKLKVKQSAKGSGSSWTPTRSSPLSSYPQD